MPMLSISTIVPYITAPATKPITTEAQGATKAQVTVMPTSAAIAPLAAMPTSMWRRCR